MDFINDRESSAAELYDIAVKAMVNAYAPFSNFKVGAALLDINENVFTGVNIENSYFGATICAERTAFVKAISEGSRSFAAIAVAAENEEALPCGICRQFMFEFAPDILIITGKNRDELHIRTLGELLPLGFRLQEGRTT